MLTLGLVLVATTAACSDSEGATLAASTTVAVGDLVFPSLGGYDRHCGTLWTFVAYGRTWVAEDWTLSDDVVPRSGTVVPLGDDVLLYTDSADGTEVRFVLSTVTGAQPVCS